MPKRVPVRVPLRVKRGPLPTPANTSSELTATAEALRIFLQNKSNWPRGVPERAVLSRRFGALSGARGAPDWSRSPERAERVERGRIPHFLERGTQPGSRRKKMETSES